MGNYKVIVAHPAQQHSYKLATALKNKKLLYKYSTTVYKKKWTLLWNVSKISKNKLLQQSEKKSCSNLHDDEIVSFCELLGLLKLVCLHSNKLKRFFNFIKYYCADCFARKVSRYAIRNNVDAVITYDDSSPLLFKNLKEKSPNIVRILDVSAANLLYMKNIYEQDMKISPEFADKLYSERKMLWNDKRMEKAKEEIDLSQYFLVGSDFVKKSLMYSGVKEDNIYIVPYGVDTDMFTYSEKIIKHTEPLKFIFVGGTKQLKGISYLLEAFLKIPKSAGTLTVVGVNNLSENLLSKYKNKIYFTGKLSHADVAKELALADVMVFPSLGDGFGLVLIEGMSTGLPVIGSVNSGAADIIEDEKNGFTIPIQNKTEIINKVNWFNENRDKIPQMSSNARNTALSLTWDKYYQTASDAVKDIIEREHKNG